MAGSTHGCSPGGFLRRPRPGEAERWGRFVALARRLRAGMDRRGLVEVLEDAWEALGTRTVLAASPHGEEQLGNLDVVRQLAARWDARGRSDPAAFARRLVELADRDPRIGLEEVEDARAGPAVQLLTVHAAKGLEWPVVCIADLGASRVPTTGRLLVDPRRGLAFRPAVPWSPDAHPTPRSAALAEVLASRELAESRRVLYVAMTRARDHLVLSGIPGRGGPRAWCAWVDPLLDTPDLRRRVRRLDDGAFPPLPPAPPAPPPEVDGSRQRAALRRLEPAAARPRLAQLSLDALQPLEGCNRRFQLRVVEGHREPGLGAAAGVAGARHRDGRISGVRRLLAAIPGEAWATGPSEEALAAGAGQLGLTVAEAEALGLAAPVRRLGQALRAFARGFAWSAAVPFRVELGSCAVEGAFDLLLRGEGEDAALSVGPGARADGGIATAVLLEALRRRAGVERRLRAAVVPVDGTGTMIGWVSSAPVALASVASRVETALALGPALAERLPRAACEALGCGFLARCHPPERGL